MDAGTERDDRMRAADQKRRGERTVPSRKEDIKDAILQGVRKANVDYEQWSRGWWVSDSGVEGLMVASIARKLNSKLSEDESLLLECPFQYVRERSEANQPPGRRPKTVAGKKRADVVLFDGKYRPTWVVEVKRKWDQGPCFKDLERIRDLVCRQGSLRTGSLEGGFLATMLSKKESDGLSAGEMIRGQIKKIEAAITNKFDHKELILRCHRGNVRNSIRELPQKFRKNPFPEENWSHVSLCIEIAIPA